MRAVASTAIPTTVGEVNSTTSSAYAPVTGNAAEGLADLLGSLGVVSTNVRDSVEDLIVTELAARGFNSAYVIELRWGTLVLGADPTTARLLRYDADTLVQFLAETHPGQVSKITIRVVRR